ncbi:hypothetical protein [Streptomyces sp. CC219B]|nr:hypothetical protein [Streptomyces sp. CC219B]
MRHTDRGEHFLANAMRGARQPTHAGKIEELLTHTRTTHTEDRTRRDRL